MSERPAAAGFVPALSRRMTDKRQQTEVFARLTRSSLSLPHPLTLSLPVQTNNSSFPLIIKSVRYNMLFPDASVQFVMRSCTSLFMLQKKSDSDRLISLKKMYSTSYLTRKYSV